MANNKEIAKIFYDIASYLRTRGVDFKPFAYQRAGDVLSGLENDVGEIYRQGGVRALEDIPGIGKSLALKIKEYLNSGKIKYYEKLKKELPVDFNELLKVEGLGPRKVRMLYQKLDIKNIKELEKAAKSHKIAPIAGFGEASEKNILEGIKFLKRDKGRFLLGEIFPIAEEIKGRLEAMKEVKIISIAGSARRMKETIGDIDFLAISDNPEKVADFFVSLPGIIKVWGKGKTKASVRMKDGFDVDLRIVPKKSYGCALQYFTGSKEHNVATRRMAMEKGLKLNEYGVFKGKKIIECETEEDVYKILGLPWIPPEIRENKGEIEAALSGSLPRLVNMGDIKGDLHCHSNWDGGKNSIEEMAEAAIDVGYEYIGISDHTKFLKIEKGINESQILKQAEKIKNINEKFSQRGSKFRILSGCEANILKDGSIDIRADTLAKLDYVIAGIHSNMKMEKGEMTRRIITAMKNPNVDIISHPTGRILKRRDEYQADFDRILSAAKETGTVLEINSAPDRLDLKDENIRRAKEAGVKMVINTDSHEKSQLNLMKYGVSQARRGWTETSDIINSNSASEFLKHLK